MFSRTNKTQVPVCNVREKEREQSRIDNPGMLATLGITHGTKANKIKIYNTENKRINNANIVKHGGE